MSEKKKILIETTKGPVNVEIPEELAPQFISNTIQYVNAGFEAEGMGLITSIAGHSTIHAKTKPEVKGPHKVLLQTSEGDITIELDGDAAPITVDNFLFYMGQGTYDGTCFHRVIKDFMIQGGGYQYKADTGFIEVGGQRNSITNESKNGLKNLRGTIAMARTGAPHSATTQFFINHKDNDFLNAGARGEWGYAVFGKVIAGIEVVDKIAEILTRRAPPFGADVPITLITIHKVSKVAT